MGRAAGIRRRQPSRAVRALRRAQRQRGARALESAVRARSLTPIASPRPSTSTWPRQAGRRRVDNYLGRVTKARILQAVSRGEGRAGGPTHRSSQEGRDGGEGARAARWLRLAAGTVAHARSQDRPRRLRHAETASNRHWSRNRRRRGSKRPWSIFDVRPKMSRPRQNRTLSRPNSERSKHSPRARRRSAGLFRFGA